MKTEAMLEKAAAMLTAERATSFSISTVIPKEWLAKEERVWDERLSGAESVKNFLNRRISSALCKSSRAAYSADGECRLIFDYAKGTVELQRNELFIFGRYRKLSAGLSQSRWRCSRCEGKGCSLCGGKGKLYESVEEIIGEPAKRLTEADDYIMHASGREDVDATNSAGRPFLLEIKNPKKRRLDLDALASEIGKDGSVEVFDLTIVPRSFAEIVTESHFDKTYEADVEFERKIGDDEIAKIRSLEGKTILQQTPRRVSHRRANLVRHRKVKHIEIMNVNGNRATLIVKAEAGTYIKELISGDGGRTNPSVAGLLGIKAECKRLDVVEIDDKFLDFCLGTM